MYDLGAYGAMIEDTVRVESYGSALRQVITPSSIVLDIGAGTGIMSLMAARFGAHRVFAIDPNPLLRVGARLAEENHLVDRICFLQGRSEQVELSEKADVVVWDLRGGLPLVPEHLNAIVDARRRLMKTDGVLLPARDTVFVAPVEAEEAFSKLVSPWQGGPFGLSMSSAAIAVLNQGTIRLTGFDQLLGTGRPIKTLEYRDVDSLDVDSVVELPIERKGVVHGLSLWFETELVAGVGFSTAPDQEKTIYGRLFLPLMNPVSVAPNDQIHARIKAVFHDEGPIWYWRGCVVGPDDTKRGSFELSSAFCNPESSVVRKVIHEECVPSLARGGRIVADILTRIDGKRSVSEIAGRIREDNPGRFKLEVDAMSFVRDVVERYGETTLAVED